MTVEEFSNTLQNDEPPESLQLSVRSLWYDFNNDWEEAHRIAQSDRSDSGSWVHAYLHRKESDKWNADYWYSRSGKTMPDLPLAEERDHILNILLAQV